MDYKYIEQLLERYFECQTTLEEEKILRAFFCQEDIPASLLMYKDMFCYESMEVENDVLGDDFDAKVLSQIESQPVVKARTIKFSHRLMPLFKAAAIVAIILTLGNALQRPFDSQNSGYEVIPGYNSEGAPSAAIEMKDSTTIDSMKRSSLSPAEVQTVAPF